MPDLNIYRRHKPECPHKAKGQNFIKCSCPFWVYGLLNGRPKRESLKTTHLSIALQRLDHMLKNRESYIAVPVPEAVKLYLRDCEARHLAPSTLTSYRNVLEPFAEFCAGRVHDVRNIGLGDFTAFRSSRGGTAKTQRKEIEHLRSLCAFCLQHKWIEENFAKKLKPPKDQGSPTLPFRIDDITKMLAACDQITNWNQGTVERARLRARALIVLLLYSGLRIIDVVKLKRSELKEGGKLVVRITKTGKAQHTKLHPDCVEALKALPVESDYFFWSGHGKLSSAVGSARRTIAMVGKLAGVKNAHPHRFRDTFSTELLANDVDLRTVQLLLGHSSYKTTEKHYAPFVKSTQAGLDRGVSTLDFTSDDRRNRLASRNLQPFGAPTKSAPVSRSAKPQTPENPIKNGDIDGNAATSEDTTSNRLK